jgi:aspartyl-tRNA(Asn)/glutamyl-tRNA(Gln) amidotransferase subunit C
MPQKLTRDDILRIATLARLELTTEETALFATQLSDILAFAEQVQAIETSGPGAAAEAPPPMPLRDDEPQPCLERDVVLGQAPASDRVTGLFTVPRVLGS